MTTSATFTVRRRREINLEAIIKRIAEKNTRVLVGFPIDAKHTPEEGSAGAETSMAVIAAKHEFGFPAEKIPERPFLRVGAANGIPEYVAITAAYLPRVLDEQIGIEKLLEALGTSAVGHIQQQIRNGTYKPNSPYTIRLKGSDKPLVDTGQMVQSVTWVIEEDGSYA